MEQIRLKDAVQRGRTYTLLLWTYDQMQIAFKLNVTYDPALSRWRTCTDIDKKYQRAASVENTISISQVQ